MHPELKALVLSGKMEAAHALAGRLVVAALPGGESYLPHPAPKGMKKVKK